MLKGALDIRKKYETANTMVSYLNLYRLKDDTVLNTKSSLNFETYIHALHENIEIIEKNINNLLYYRQKYVSLKISLKSEGTEILDNDILKLDDTLNELYTKLPYIIDCINYLKDFTEKDSKKDSKDIKIFEKIIHVLELIYIGLPEQVVGKIKDLLSKSNRPNLTLKELIHLLSSMNYLRNEEVDIELQTRVEKENNRKIKEINIPYTYSDVNNIMIDNNYEAKFQSKKEELSEFFNKIETIHKHYVVLLDMNDFIHNCFTTVITPVHSSAGEPNNLLEFINLIPKTGTTLSQSDLDTSLIGTIRLFIFYLIRLYDYRYDLENFNTASVNTSMYLLFSPGGIRVSDMVIMEKKTKAELNTKEDDIDNYEYLNHGNRPYYLGVVKKLYRKIEEFLDFFIEISKNNSKLNIIFEEKLKYFFNQLKLLRGDIGDESCHVPPERRTRKLGKYAKLFSQDEISIKEFLNLIKDLLNECIDTDKGWISLSNKFNKLFNDIYQKFDSFCTLYLEDNE